MQKSFVVILNLFIFNLDKENIKIAYFVFKESFISLNTDS